MATPFDEKSVDFCQELDLPIIKVASASSIDWPLLERIAQPKKPVIISVGGASEQEIDNLVDYFTRREIPLALNHCVAAYPTEDLDLQLNQIDWLKHRYPNVAIGFSSHEYNDWTSSIKIAFAKGAQIFERHIDIESPNGISKYSSTPDQIDIWFKAFLKAKEMCGNSSNERIMPNRQEVEFIQSYVRGVYAREDIRKGQNLDQMNYYFAIPLLPGQISSGEVTDLCQGRTVMNAIAKDSPILKSDLG
jgi:N-acetylneuraminate synthase